MASFSALNQGSTYYADRVENGVVQLNYSYGGCQGYASGTSTTVPSCTSVPAAGTKLAFPNVPAPVAGPALTGSLHPVGGNTPMVTALSATPSYSFHGLDPNFVPPYAHEFDLSVEQQLPGKMSMSVGYVGTRGMRLPVFIDANLVGQTPHGSRSFTVQDGGNNVTKVLTVPVYLPTDRRNQALSSFNTGFSIANTWYNSLAATVRRPFSSGFEAILNYTWSHASDTGQVQGSSGTFYGGDTPLDPNNIKGDNGLSDIDVRNRFTMSLVYKPRILENNAIVKHVLDDWTFSAAEIASAGQPLFLGLSGSTINAGNTAVSNGVITSYGDDGGIYGGAISSSSGGATNGRPPQVGRNSIIGPGFNGFDVRLSRDIPIYKEFHMTFSADAFNVLNHKIVSGVVTTYSTYLLPGASTTGQGLTYTCKAAATPTGSPQQGCFVPYLASAAPSNFGSVTGTGSNLYGARQMEFKAKFVF